MCKVRRVYTSPNYGFYDTEEYWDASPKRTISKVWDVSESV